MDHKEQLSKEKLVNYIHFITTVVIATSEKRRKDWLNTENWKHYWKELRFKDD